MSFGRRMLLATLLLSAASGCQSFRSSQPLPAEVSAGFYQQAHIRYRLDAGKMNVPVTVSHVEGQLVSYQQLPSTPIGNQALGELEIIYPHPAGKPGYALARVHIRTKLADPKQAAAADGAAKSESFTAKMGKTLDPRRWWAEESDVAETWELDVPKPHIDYAISALTARGYFENSKPMAPQATLSTLVDGHKSKREFDQLPEFDSLMLDVRRYGQLVSYRGSRAALAQSSAKFSSNTAKARLSRVGKCL